MWRRWIWVAGYVALIFSLSSIPHLAPPTDVSNADKAAHFLEYFVLGMLLARGWMGTAGGGGGRAWILAVVVGMTVAALDEFYQGTVGRDRSLGDWTADTLGLMAGSGVMVSGWIDRILHRAPAPSEGGNP